MSVRQVGDWFSRVWLGVGSLDLEPAQPHRCSITRNRLNVKKSDLHRRRKWLFTLITFEAFYVTILEFIKSMYVHWFIPSGDSFSRVISSQPQLYTWCKFNRVLIHNTTNDSLGAQG